MMSCTQHQPTVMILMLSLLSTAGGPAASAARAERPTREVAQVIAGNTRFALDLYGRLRDRDGNLALSPYGISTALAMTYAGARGETARQMADVLHFDLPREDLHAAFAGMMAADRAAAEAGGYEFHLANALWGQQSYDFLGDYLDLTHRHYGAGLREVDFVHAAEQARQAINAWVAEHTADQVRELIHRGELTSDTTLVLANAIFFQGDWSSRFAPRHTRKGPFRINAEQQVDVPMMWQAGQFRCGWFEDLAVLELPYDGDRLAMVILLPADAGGLAAVEESLAPQSLERWLGAGRTQPVRVTLPRFQLDTRFNLADTLQALGMTEAFAGGRADFSGMTGRRELFLSLVIHQARIEVDEAGTEAAAGTGVVLKRGSPPPDFTADHPFLFLVRDRQTGAILFLGRVMDPRG